MGNDSLVGASGSDSLIGDAGNDNLNGGAGLDKLQGGADNDILNGGTDADDMAGGTGNDIYFIDNLGDKITEDLSNEGGIDLVNSAITFSLADKAGVEKLTLIGNSNADGAGNTLNNLIQGEFAL